MPEINNLTTKEVARLCRVSDATVKRWSDSGLLKFERTSGGHRRFRVEEIARFQRETGLGLKQSHSDDSATRAAVRRRPSKSFPASSLLEILVSGREEETANILINSFLHGESPAEIFDGALTDAMRRIGELWMNNELNIAQEHLATRTAASALHKLRAVIPVPQMTGNLAMCCAIENDFHELPPQLAQIVLESAGWEVLNFGANMPLFSLADEILQHSPELLCLSATMILDIERTARDYRELRAELSKHDIAVAVGGRPFADERIRQRFPADLYAESFSQLFAFAAKIAGK